MEQVQAAEENPWENGRMDGLPRANAARAVVRASCLLGVGGTGTSQRYAVLDLQKADWEASDTTWGTVAGHEGSYL